MMSYALVLRPQPSVKSRLVGKTPISGSMRTRWLSSLYSSGIQETLPTSSYWSGTDGVTDSVELQLHTRFYRDECEIHSRLPPEKIENGRYRPKVSHVLRSSAIMRILSTPHTSTPQNLQLRLAYKIPIVHIKPWS